MRSYWIVLSGVFVVALLSVSFSFAYWHPDPFSYKSSIYSIKADTTIRHLYINGGDVAAKYQIFQLEENYQQLWKLESPKRFVAPVGAETLMTYSSLYTFDVIKTFIFREDGFTANISKCYIVSGFDENNQILVDVHNVGWVHWFNGSFRFFLPGWSLDNPFPTMTVSILYSNVPVDVQEPRQTNPTELQFNFNNQSDRDIAYHQAGSIETALFNVTFEVG
jgi:hypothetical protein